MFKWQNHILTFFFLLVMRTLSDTELGFTEKEMLFFFPVTTLHELICPYAAPSNLYKITVDSS